MLNEPDVLAGSIFNVLLSDMGKVAKKTEELEEQTGMPAEVWATPSLGSEKFSSFIF